jgi:hypothetical protein
LNEDDELALLEAAIADNASLSASSSKRDQYRIPLLGGAFPNQANINAKQAVADKIKEAQKARASSAAARKEEGERDAVWGTVRPVDKRKVLSKPPAPPKTSRGHVLGRGDGPSEPGTGAGGGGGGGLV